MRKSLLLIIILVITLLVGCNVNKDEKIINKIQKLYDESLGYEVKLEMKVITDDKETLYKMKEKFLRDGDVSLEILEPNQSKGITIEYKGDKIFLNHASIKQSISLKMVKSFDKGILLSSFYEDLDNINSLEEKKIDGKDYFVIEHLPKKTNKYNSKKNIYLDKKELNPYMMEVKDADDNIRMIIKYDEFKYIKDI